MKASSKSSLFLIELIIAIFFFLLASAVCVQLFAFAHLKSEESIHRNLAVLQAQTIAEQFRNEKGDVDMLLQTAIFDGSDGVYTCYFDTTGEFIDMDSEPSADEHFVMTLVPTTEENRLATLAISIQPPQGDTAIFEMETSIYNSYKLEEE